MSEYIYEETPSGSDVFGRPVDAPMLTRREEIVRCRDCKHRYEGFCMLTDGMGDFKRWLVDDDDYCSDGEVSADE